MDRIWWFGISDMIPMLCNGHLGLVPEMEQEYLVDKIISTVRHGVEHGDPSINSVVDTDIRYRDILYIVQNICRLTYPTSEITTIFLQNMSIRALRVVQHYFALSNTLILVAEYVQTNVPIDWILADHLIGLLHIIQKLVPHTLVIRRRYNRCLYM